MLRVGERADRRTDGGSGSCTAWRRRRRARERFPSCSARESPLSGPMGGAGRRAAGEEPARPRPARRGLPPLPPQQPGVPRTPGCRATPPLRSFPDLGLRVRLGKGPRWPERPGKAGVRVCQGPSPQHPQVCCTQLPTPGAATVQHSSAARSFEGLGCFETYSSLARKPRSKGPLPTVPGMTRTHG